MTEPADFPTPPAGSEIPQDTGPRPFYLWAEITSIFMVVMEVSWISLWYRALVRAESLAPPPASFLVLAAIMLAAYLIARLLERLRLINSLHYLVLGAGFLASLLVGGGLLLRLPNQSIGQALLSLNEDAVITVFASLWLWWRGISLVRALINPNTVWSRFWIGTLMFVAYYLVIVRVTGEGSGIATLVLFLITGLLALVTSRIAYISLYHGATRNPFGRNWLGTMSVTIGGTVLLAALIGSLMTGTLTGLMEALTSLVRWIVVIILFVASIPWLLLAYLLEPLVPLLRQALASLPTPTPTPTLSPQEAQSAYPMQLYPPPEAIAPLSPWLVSLCFWAVVLILAIIFIRSFRSRRRGEALRTGYTDAESLLEDQDLLTLLRQSVGDQVRKVLDGLNNLRPSRRRLAARIRQVYSDLMDMAIELRTPRPPARTPLEFLPDLEELFPSLTAELQTITHAYVKIRYGELPESNEEVEAVELAWEKILIEGKRIKRTLPPVTPEYPPELVD